MYARVATVTVQVQHIEEAIRIYRDNVVPALRTERGFEGAELLVNRETGHGISITRWASQDDQIASELSGFYRAQVAKFRGILDALPVREAYEVVVFE